MHAMSPTVGKGKPARSSSGASSGVLSSLGSSSRMSSLRRSDADGESDDGGGAAEAGSDDEVEVEVGGSGILSRPSNGGGEDQKGQDANVHTPEKVGEHGLRFSGYLLKKGGGTRLAGRRNWKRRWFELVFDDRAGVLNYYADEGGELKVRQVPLKFLLSLLWLAVLIYVMLTPYTTPGRH